MLSRAIALMPLLLAALPGCSDSCPAASQAGDCQQANVVEDPEPAVQALTLKEGCDYLPLEYCRQSGSDCVLGGGDDHRFSYIVISDQQAWDDLAASLAADCLPDGIPSSWPGHHLLLATLSATGAEGAEIKHWHYSHADGQPHVVLDLRFDHDPDCDCAAQASLALVFDSDKAPSVCAKAQPACK